MYFGSRRERARWPLGQGAGLSRASFRCAARARAVAMGPLRGREPRVMFRRAEIPSGCLARRVISARGKRVRRPQGRGAGVSRASWFSARGDPVRVPRAASPGCKQLGECSGGRLGRPKVSARAGHKVARA